MSFSSEIKKELTTAEPGKKCCQLALITGFLRFAGSITFSGGGMGIKVVTDNPAIARLFINLCKDYFGAKAALFVAEPAPLAKGCSYELAITPELNADAILRECGMISVQQGHTILTDGIAQNIIKKRCCKKAFLRGAFMAAGSISDPYKSYHMEISCATPVMAADVRKLINSFGLKSKVSERRGKYVVYIKDGEQIEDFISILGANSKLFKYQDVRITKEMKNKTNRLMNCESANVERTVSAAQKQLAEIDLIDRTVGLDSLPEKLRETALLRRDNPELSLSELAQVFDPPLKKSGLNHRLEKIFAISEKIRKEYQNN